MRDPSAGAIVIFQGVTREVEPLDYEAYARDGHERIAAIVARVRRATRPVAAAAEHRVGGVALGEPSVIVAVSAAHRAEAFAGAREIIDRIKAEAPIWKREIDATAQPARRRDTAPGATVTRRAPASERERARASPTSTSRAARAWWTSAPRSRAERVARARARGANVARDTRPRGRRPATRPRARCSATARLAGIQAAKRTDELIPLAHPLALTFVDVAASVDAEAGLRRARPARSTRSIAPASRWRR